MFSFLWLYSMAALACALVSLVGGLPTLAVSHNIDQELSESQTDITKE